MTLQDVLLAVLLIAGLLVIAKWIRRLLPPLQKLFLPSSIIAGALAMLVGPQLLGRIIPETGIGSAGYLAGGLWSEVILDIWSAMPGLLISIVFAGLFLGKSLPSPRAIWKQAGPMVAHGQTLAWGQYVVGLLLVVLILGPFFDANPLAGALIEISFEGGHGTAAGLGDTFRELGFADGADLALGLATVGVVAGVILGTILINWAVWKGHIPRPDSLTREDEEEMAEYETLEKDSIEDRMSDQSIEPLSIHLGFVAFAVGLGWLILEGMIWLEATLLVPLGWPQLLVHIPLFPLAMIGGVLVQILGEKKGYAGLIDRQIMNRISGVSLDLLIVAALATLSLEVLGDNAMVFILLIVGGVLWNLFGFIVLARYMFSENWVTNGLANFGQGMGMTVIGLLLVRMSDPRGRTGAMESFGYKQLLFEPVVGGGLFTAASLPLIYEFGAVPVLIGVSILMFGWMIFGIWQFRPGR